MTKYGILGATGFVGSHIKEHLTQVQRPFAATSLSLGVDARDSASLATWINKNHVTHLINLAADCGGIGLNKREPGRLWLSVSQITTGVLEAARMTKLQKLVMIGTVCSYAKDCPTPFTEDHLMHYGMPEPTNAGYGVAKLSGLFGSQSYRKQYGLNIIYLLPVNLYGPYDNFDPAASHVIPALIKKCIDARDKDEKSIVCWGTGKASREFLYAADAAHAIVMAAEAYNEPEPINIGSGNEIQIRDLVEIIAKLTHFKGKIVWDDSYPDGQPRRCLDVSRAKNAFGFSASTPFERGLEATIAWYEKTRNARKD